MPAFKISNKKSILPILSLVMVVNALSYGIIIPLLYPFAAQYGINATGLALLFSSFSFFQFLATPIIGRMSDRYGRKPLLLISLFGTSISLALFAGARSIPMLFFARILDGITGGNNSVAQAVIADSFEGKDRAKAFGTLGASFGIGFLIGPALGGLLSPIDITAPFWFAAGVALVGTILGVILLPETLAQKNRTVATNEPLFDLKRLVTALKLPTIGVLLVLSMLSFLAHSVFVIGFQTYTVDILKLSPRQIAALFAAFGFVSILVQGGGIKYVLKIARSQMHILRMAFLFSVPLLIAMALSNNWMVFTALCLLYPVVFTPQSILIANLISINTRNEDQGILLGVNQSYLSIGQIVGPLIAGVVATYSIHAVFVLTAGVFGVALLLTQWYHRRAKANV